MNKISLKRLQSSRFLLDRLDGDLEMIAEFELTKKDSNVVRKLFTIHSNVSQLLNERGNSHD